MTDCSKTPKLFLPETDERRCQEDARLLRAIIREWSVDRQRHIPPEADGAWVRHNRNVDEALAALDRLIAAHAHPTPAGARGPHPNGDE